MKTKITIITMALALTLPMTGTAKDSMRSSIDRTPSLTPVQWMGNFRCDEKIHERSHSKEHECDLKFVNDETGDEWNVKNNSDLQSLHQKNGGVVKVHVRANKSPRFLLGGSYIEIQKIELLPGDTKEAKPSTQADSNTAHLCSL